MKVNTNSTDLKPNIPKWCDKKEVDTKTHWYAQRNGNNWALAIKQVEFEDSVFNEK